MTTARHGDAQMADAGSVRAPEVHVWVARLDQPAAAHAALAACLTADEREHAAAVRSAVRRRRSVVAHGVLRLLLARRLGCRPEDLPITRSPQRKPAVATPTGAPARERFSLAYAQDTAVIALARDVEVGVDVERVRPPWNTARLAARILTAQEHSAFEAAADPVAWLLRRWTVKEAVLKGLGDGLSREPASVAVDDRPRGDPRVVWIDGRRSSWTVRSLDPATGCVGAVAVRAPQWTVRLRPWSAPEPLVPEDGRA